MFFVIMLVVFFGRNFILMFIAVGAVEWLDMARIVRGQTLSIKRQEFVQAAEALGQHQRHPQAPRDPEHAGTGRGLHDASRPEGHSARELPVVPGPRSPGADDELGRAIPEGAPRNIQGSTWMLVFPSIFLVATLFCLNFIGDGLRDALDPKDR